MKSNKDTSTFKQEAYLGIRLRTAIKHKGVKQIEVCKAVGLSPSRLSNYLSGSREPDFNTLCRVAAYLKKPLEYFSLYHAQNNVEVDTAAKNSDKTVAAIDVLYDRISGMGTKSELLSRLIDVIEGELV
jgi:transcriptional regulator with XRE-family HTH domain